VSGASGPSSGTGQSKGKCAETEATRRGTPPAVGMACRACRRLTFPRRSQETVLYGLVEEHLSEFLQHTRDIYEAPLPKYVHNEFRNYLACGDFAHGFVHARCTSCRHDLAVAFSCKVRGLCPSCAGRRMANAAAPLVDRVLPAVPVRHSSRSSVV